jgi:hypothetical protein
LHGFATVLAAYRSLLLQDRLNRKHLPFDPGPSELPRLIRGHSSDPQAG